MPPFRFPERREFIGILRVWGGSCGKELMFA